MFGSVQHAAQTTHHLRPLAATQTAPSRPKRPDPPPGPLLVDAPRRVLQRAEVLGHQDPFGHGDLSRGTIQQLRHDPSGSCRTAEKRPGVVLWGSRSIGCIGKYGSPMECLGQVDSQKRTTRVAEQKTSSLRHFEHFRQTCNSQGPNPTCRSSSLERSSSQKSSNSPKQNPKCTLPNLGWSSESCNS